MCSARDGDGEIICKDICCALEKSKPGSGLGVVRQAAQTGIWVVVAGEAVGGSRDLCRVGVLMSGQDKIKR